jgi:hypothetical protein
MRSQTRALWLGFSSLALGLCACTAPHKLISARHTSCPPRKLEIRELVTAADREDWIAVCGTRSFACSTREKGRRLVYACHALADPNDAGSPAIDAASASGESENRTLAAHASAPEGDKDASTLTDAP